VGQLLFKYKPFGNCIGRGGEMRKRKKMAGGRGGGRGGGGGGRERAP